MLAQLIKTPEQIKEELSIYLKSWIKKDKIQIVLDDFERLGFMPNQFKSEPGIEGVNFAKWIAKNEFYSHNGNCFTSPTLDGKTFTSEVLYDEFLLTNG